MFYFYIYTPTKGRKAANMMMQWRYTHFIVEKFNYPAFGFSMLYFLFKGYFLAFLSLGSLIFGISIIARYIDGLPILSLYLSITVITGFYAYWLEGISLKARGYKLSDVILAHNLSEAQYIYARKHLLEESKLNENQVNT